MKKPNIDALLAQHGDNPLAILAALGGFYECPKNGDMRLGPLVGYAGKYDAGNGTFLQFVGDVYANFSKAEQFPLVMRHFATMLWRRETDLLSSADIICGPQMGGVAIAMMLAYETGSEFAYIEKDVKQLATETLREQADLKFIRHTINAGQKVVIAEDVLNNFSTAKDTIAMIEEAGGEVIGIAGLLNRSATIIDEFDYYGRKIPVVSLVYKPFEQYRQDDPFVAADMEAQNVVLKPKNNWEKLADAMKKMTV